VSWDGNSRRRDSGTWAGDSPASLEALGPRPLDPVLLGAVLALMTFGVIMVYSASIVRASQSFGDPDFFLKRTLANVAVGIVALVIGAATPLRWYRKSAYVLLLTSIVLMVLVLLVGRTVNNATRWFDLGFARFQPTELAKAALILYLAASLVKKSDRIRSLGFGFAPHLGVAVVLVALALKQPDFGTALTMMAMMLAMLYVGGTKLKYIAGVGVLGIPVVILAVLASPMRMYRLISFLEPERYCNTSFGFHLCQSQLAVSSGGVDGLGLGMSLQKLFYLPEAHNDFLMAIVVEELGLLGMLAVVGLFALLAWRGLRASLQASSLFGRYLAFGITVQLTLQAAVNMAVVTGALPTKGLTLPFMSYGGSSMAASCWMAGMLLSISRSEPEPEPSGPNGRARTLGPEEARGALGWRPRRAAL